MNTLLNTPGGGINGFMILRDHPDNIYEPLQ